MTISRDAWQKYIKNLASISERAKELMLKYIEEHDVESKEDRQALIDFAYGISTKYGEAAVAKLIRQCMASGWQGIIFDRLSQGGYTQQRGRKEPVPGWMQKSEEAAAAEYQQELARMRRAMAADDP